MKFENETYDNETVPLLSPKQKQEIHYAKANRVYLMLGGEFGESYSYYGILTILSLFLRNVQLYSESTSKIIFHTFCMLAYSIPIIGSVFGDSLIGKYKTVVYFSIILIIGSGMIAISALPSLPLELSKFFTLVSLFIVAVGVGGIKPTIPSFGGDQFKLPNQLIQLTKFFTIYYFVMNCGAVLTVIFTPMFRKDVHCFGEDTCYSLAFGVQAVVTFVGLLIFLFGSKSYTVRPTTDSVLINAIKCIMQSVSRNMKSFWTSNSKNDHFLDSTSDRFDIEFINDTKTLLQKCKIFSPLIIFWSLWTQIGSSWIFQATLMDGVIFNGFTIKPDQTLVGTTILILIFIPIFTRIIYPITTSKFHILETHLQRIGFGCFLISVSFIMAGCLQLELQKSYPTIPNSNESNINFVNTLPCNVTLNITNGTSPIPITNSSIQIIVGKYDNFLLSKIPSIEYKIDVTESCFERQQNTKNEIQISLLPRPSETETIIIYADKNQETLQLINAEITEDLTKSFNGNAKIRVQCVGLNFPNYYSITFNSTSTNVVFNFSDFNSETLTVELLPDKYDVYLGVNNNNVNGQEEEQLGFLGTVELRNGESSLIVVFSDTANNNTIMMQKYILTFPNNISILWMFPQILIIAMSEVLVAPSAYQFAYEESPVSMKALVQSIWLLTNAGGNLLIVIITVLNIFPNQVVVFFSYAALMLVGLCIFIYLSKTYSTKLYHEPMPK